MTRRPDPFNQAALEATLLELGCPESFISTTISNYRLFVPLLFAELGEARVFELLDGARAEFGLGEQETAWRSTVKYIVAWADEVIHDYKQRRSNAPEDAGFELQQPRLF